MAVKTCIKLTNIIAKLPEEAVDYLYETACRMFEDYPDNERPCCPYCNGNAIVRNGHKCGKQEYRFKTCGKTFVSTTNTLMANSHQPRAIWESVINDTVAGETIDFTAKRLDLTHDLDTACGINSCLPHPHCWKSSAPACSMLPKWMRPMYWNPIKGRNFRTLSAVPPAGMVQKQKKERTPANTSASVPVHSVKDT